MFKRNNWKQLQQIHKIVQIKVLTEYWLSTFVLSCTSFEQCVFFHGNEHKYTTNPIKIVLKLELRKTQVISQHK